MEAVLTGAAQNAYALTRLCDHHEPGRWTLSRLRLHPQSHRRMAQLTKELAAEVCAGRLAMIHEGGYSKIAVPFCDLATL